MAREYYELKPSDVENPHIRAFGRTWPVSGFIGRVLPQDVGKRVYQVLTDDGARSILQVENDEQRARRLAKRAT